MNEEDRRLIAELEEANAELKDSLRKCRKLVTDCRAQLVANGNEPFMAAADRNAQGDRRR